MSLKTERQQSSNVGYEPKGFCCHCDWMAMKRASSEGPNPFWSTRAREELALQMARPSTLPSTLPPVPADGDWDLDRTPEPLMPPSFFQDTSEQLD